MVIGCAFRKTANRVFEAVCDDFIWIEEPKDEYAQVEDTSEFTNPILIEFSKRFKPKSIKREEIFEESIQILNFLATNKDASYLLKNAGLNISIFSQAVSYRISNFNYVALGFTKFVDFIRYVSNKTKIKLIHNPPSEYRLLSKNSSVKGFDDVEPIFELGEIHTVKNYNLLLSKGVPIFRLPSTEIIYNLTHHLSENKLVYQSLFLGDIIEKIGSDYDYEQNDIKGCILSLVSAGSFMREPEDGKLSEQKLSFIPQSSEQALNMLKEAMYRKLEDLLGNVEEEVFIEVFS